MSISGFIDLHVHGFGRYDTRAGKASHILELALLCGRAGTAAILPTVYPAPVGVMRKNMQAMAEAMAAASAPGAADILGVHLEGPFLSPRRGGALPAEYFLPPTLTNLRGLVDGFEGIVKIMTIAPELPGALRVIERCVSQGIRVNMGHSDATHSQALKGKRAGASGVTHLFNAMRTIHHREPGLAGLGLLDDDLFVEIVADGVHLNPEIVRLVFRVKPADRVVLVSDAIKGRMYKEGVLQGSKTLLPRAAGRLLDMGIPEGLIIQAGRENPKRYLKL
jgi:N-acetylglucosamine-6-phosphate deacetylase